MVTGENSGPSYKNKRSGGTLVLTEYIHSKIHTSLIILIATWTWNFRHFNFVHYDPLLEADLTLSFHHPLGSLPGWEKLYSERMLQINSSWSLWSVPLDQAPSKSSIKDTLVAPAGTCWLILIAHLWSSLFLSLQNSMCAMLGFAVIIF